MCWCLHMEEEEKRLKSEKDMLEQKMTHGLSTVLALLEFVDSAAGGGEVGCANAVDCTGASWTKPREELAWGFIPSANVGSPQYFSL